MLQSRRSVLLQLSIVAGAGFTGRPLVASEESAGTAPKGALSKKAPSKEAVSKEAVLALEKRAGGRLGVAVLDMSASSHFGHRADERFAMCSTFKLLAVAFVLARVDRGEEQLARRVAFSRADLLEHAPVATARVAEGALSIAELCEASITVSDNTAANLLLKSFGGPAALTRYARTLGDGMTRLDRDEPMLNMATAGDPRDTTTPNAMLGNLKVLLTGDALSKASCEQLCAWLVASKTGLERLRAGLPAAWRAGDKTGSGNNGTTNDVAIVWPPERPPILIAAYLTETRATPAEKNGVFADLARLVVAASEPKPRR